MGRARSDPSTRRPVSGERVLAAREQPGVLGCLARLRAGRPDRGRAGGGGHAIQPPVPLLVCAGAGRRLPASPGARRWSCRSRRGGRGVRVCAMAARATRSSTRPRERGHPALALTPAAGLSARPTGRRPRWMARGELAAAARIHARTTAALLARRARRGRRRALVEEASEDRRVRACSHGRRRRRPRWLRAAPVAPLRRSARRSPGGTPERGGARVLLAAGPRLPVSTARRPRVGQRDRDFPGGAAKTGGTDAVPRGDHGGTRAPRRRLGTRLPPCAPGRARDRGPSLRLACARLLRRAVSAPAGALPPSLR